MGSNSGISKIVACVKDFLKRYFWDLILYFSLGCFSYFFIIRFSDIPFRKQQQLVSVNMFLAVVFLFSCLGLGLRYVNTKLMRYYHSYIRSYRSLIMAVAVAALVLLMYNYLLMASSKWLAGLDNPFVVKRGGLSVILIVWFMEIIIVGQYLLNRFYAELMRLHKRAEELEESTAQARYMALQNQLNPHFLFNNLNTLISEIEESPVNAIEFTRNLADTYRYILFCQGKNTVPLYEEMNFVETYIKLHKVRLGDCLNIENNIDEDYMDMSVPPLTLQLLIENVIKHNVISVGRPMTIRLYTELVNNEMWMVVSNAVRPKKDIRSSGKGLANLSQRYNLLYGKDIVVEKTGENFVVRLPMEIE